MDLFDAAPHRKQRGFVHQVREVGAAHSGRPARQDVDVDVGRDLLVAHVDLEDLDALLLGRQRHDDLAVEAAGAQQRWVEHVRAVRGGHHDNALSCLEAVHLREHLVEGLLTLVVTTAEPRAALAADGVDLVDKDDRRSLLAGRLEQVAHAGGADSDEHLHEVGAGDRNEGHAGFARDGAGDQRFSGAGRADEQDTLGNTRADLPELRRVFQEVDDLGDLGLDRRIPGNVRERRLGLLSAVHLGPAAADVHDGAHARGLSPSHPHEETDDEQDREKQREQVEQEVRAVLGVGEVDVLLSQQPDRVLLEVVLGSGAREALGSADVGIELSVDVAGVLVEFDALDVAVLDVVEERRIREVLGAARTGRDARQREHRDQGEDEQPRQDPCPRGRRTRRRRPVSGAPLGTLARRATRRRRHLGRRTAHQGSPAPARRAGQRASGVPDLLHGTARGSLPCPRYGFSKEIVLPRAPGNCVVSIRPRQSLG